MSGIGDEDVIDPSDISASYGNKFGTGLDNTVKDKRNREINKYVVDDNDDDNESDNDNMSSSQQARGANYSGADGLRSDRILFGSDDNNDKGSNKNGNRNKRPMSLSPDREDMFTSSKVLSSSSVSGREYKDVIREAMENKEKANAEKDNINGDQQGASAVAAPPSKRSRWDMQPKGQSAASKPSDTEATPLIISQNMKTPLTFDHGMAKTPMHLGFIGSENKSDDGVSIESDNARVSADLMKRMKIDREIAILNRPLSDAELDEILPKEGYVIITPPDNYVPIRTPARISLSTPAPMDNKSIFSMSSSETPSRDLLGDGSSIATSQTYQSMLGSTVSAGDLPYIPPEDMQFFGKLMTPASEDATKEEIKERLIMELLLKIKNGNPSQRKSAMRIITEKARDFGAQALFSQILPIMMSPTIEDQDRHQMVKVIDRVLFKLDDMIRPFVHKILAVIQPMLSSEDYYVRIEAREILSNVAKAAGLATMIATMRPDIDSPDDFVRKTTAQAFAVVANSLGVPTVLPFIKAVCQSRKSWQARHTGVKIIQQISILLGCAILPFLGQLVVIIKDGLTDEENKVRVMTSLAVASLAEAANPYGFECFGPVLKPLLDGARSHRGKSLTAYLKAMGCIISLMDQDYASRYTRDIMPILIREFKSPDEETKSIVLRVVKQCVSTGGIDPQFVREQIVPEYFRCFWIRRIALERRNYAQLIDTTVEIGKKVGCGEILSKLVIDLRDESEPYRRMVMETIDKLVQKLGLSDVDGRLEEQLIDGVVFAFVEQTQSDQVPIIGKIQNDRALGAAGSGIMLNGFSTVMNALGKRAKPYLPQITASALYRLHNKSSDVRMQAVDLISRLAPILKMCDEEGLLARCGHVLFENLGEEYPEVLGSILGALRSIVSVIGIDNMKPPIHDLLPRLTPILKNRHEKVQENAIDLVGRIADRGAEYVSAREWIRICFELLEMLKAGRKSIRRAAVSTFGFVAKAIGPSDVLHTLLNNLKVQERQLRVCTTVAIAIVAETCEPFTVLPALMNEYRVPDTNIQNGVLKALSFLFEYIGPVAKDYIYSIVPLLQDALIDRDMVHRQIACTCVKHIALGVQGQGCEDALMHLLNFVWPNIFETSPHVIHAVLESIEALRVSLGSHIIFLYVLQGLFHPAKRIRETYWRIYNNLYVYSVESLIPVFPRLEDDSGDLFLDNTHLRKKKKVEESGGLPNSFPASYQREYLDMFL